jgi:hypothetical protein
MRMCVCVCVCVRIRCRRHRRSRRRRQEMGRKKNKKKPCNNIRVAAILYIIMYTTPRQARRGGAGGRTAKGQLRRWHITFARLRVNLGVYCKWNF